jgi:hypothetical protein
LRPDDLTGKKFGRLTGIRRVENVGRQTMWLWQCDCGNQKTIAADKAKCGHTVSCGCYWPEICRKHGHSHDENANQSRTYKAWVNMRSRVAGVTESYRVNYSSRGISVCDRWAGSFENFLSDMGVCPPGLTLERENNDGNYEPGNCVWATMAKQNSNRRDTLRVTVDGDRMCLAHACKRAGVLYDTAMHRIRRGMTAQEAFDS